GVGGGLVRMAALLAPAWQSSAMLSFAIACSAGALVVAIRLHRGYLGTLASSLVDLSRREAAGVGATANALRSSRVIGPEIVAAAYQRRADTDILSLRSRNRQRVVDVLSREDGLGAELVPHAITLLAWDQVADHALFALRKVAEERIGQLVDAL